MPRENVNNHYILCKIFDAQEIKKVIVYGISDVEIRVGLRTGVEAQGLMRENISEILGEIKLTNPGDGGGGRNKAFCVDLLRSDANAVVEEIWQENHWNEREKTKGLTREQWLAE